MVNVKDIAMIERLVNKEIKKVENARIARDLNPMHDRELSELMADVICLLYGLEWLDSCDIGEETYKKCVNKFKAKWMHRKENDRLNSYAEDLKRYYEKLVEDLKRYYEKLVEELKGEENAEH